jgi:hypothetical protein
MNGIFISGGLFRDFRQLSLRSWASLLKVIQNSSAASHTTLKVGWVLEKIDTKVEVLEKIQLKVG